MVIATVLLTIVGMIGGYLLSERHGESSSSPSDTGSDVGTPSGAASSAPELLAVEGECTEHTQEMARDAGALLPVSQVLRITTTGGSVIWICQDKVGKLYYHANKGGEDAKWVEGQTALFIPNMTVQPDGSFQGVAPQDGSIFNVTPFRLLITPKHGEPKVQNAVPS
ncbi:hypothetical protein [Actinoplanes sp. HUAS TT8]|uniref:hypothetical protein n=1 Tax=Actinoplanes sp. HUAS TT8 TaxID=3447453 RepID=UPI003F51D686